MHHLTTPLSEDDITKLKVCDEISLSGYIYCGRDAVLPKIVKLYSNNLLTEYNIDLKGSLIFHTAVSPAGVGPTSSNKLEIESSIAPLSEAGVKIHLGKGKISKETIDALNRYNSIFAVVPPVTALLQSKIQDIQLVAFPEEGMEAFYRVKVQELPMIVAAAHGKSIYEE
jgi:fumarate hydratase subunit beta